MAAPSIVAAQAEANRAYEAKFGYTFIVCATGRTASKLLAMLKQRLNNDAAVEIHNAAEQQRLILHLRLRKMLSE